MAELSSIEIAFKQKSTTFIERSERGIGILILRDDTEGPQFKKYKDITEVQLDKEKYTEENYKYLEDIYICAPYEINVIRLKTTEGEIKTNISDALVIINKMPTGWVTIADGDTEDYAALASWTKTQEMNNKTFKSIVWKQNKPDNMHIVNFMNEKVTFIDERKEQEAVKFIPSLLGILTACNITRSCDNFICTNLEAVKEVEDTKETVKEGGFVLSNVRGAVRVLVGANSLVTLDGETKTADMQYIDNVERQDLIRDDITDIFQNHYAGPGNTFNRQIMFISACKQYFDSLAEIEVLDSEYENDIDIDVERQRKAWINAGRSEVEKWKDSKIRRTTFKRKMFLDATVKFIAATADLHLNINLF